MEKKRVIHRDELYEKIWKVTASILASEYGISDVALSKICKKLKVPKPPRGYWTKLQFGKRVKRIPLPKLDPKDSTSHTLYDRSEPDVSPQSSPKISVSDAERKFSNKIRVLKSLRSPHPLVNGTQKVLSEKRPDEYGVVRPWRSRYLNLRVSPKSLNRALRIMDALIKVLESNGYKVVSEGGEESSLPETSVKIGEEKVRFALYEKVQRVDPSEIKQNNKINKKYSWREGDRWAYFPTGKLSLLIEEYTRSGIRKRFSDTARHCVEDLLNDFVIGLIETAEVLKRERLQREAEKKKWEEEQRRLGKEREARLAEEERLRDLEKQAEQWTKSQQLWEYIQAVENIIKNKNFSPEDQKSVDKWLSWAKKHADSLDPLRDLKKRINR